MYITGTDETYSGFHTHIEIAVVTLCEQYGLLKTCAQNQIQILYALLFDRLNNFLISVNQKSSNNKLHVMSCLRTQTE